MSMLGRASVAMTLLLDPKVVLTQWDRDRIADIIEELRTRLETANVPTE